MPSKQNNTAQLKPAHVPAQFGRNIPLFPDIFDATIPPSSQHFKRYMQIIFFKCILHSGNSYNYFMKICKATC